MKVSLSTIDYLIIAIYLVTTMGIGLFLSGGMKSGKDFFLGGRRLPWWAIGMSLVATDIGGTDIIGVGGATYQYGIASANFEWIGCVPIMIVAAFVFIPFFYRTGIYTIPEYMEKRFNVSVRTVLACCWLAFMACNIGIMLFASAKMVSGMIDLSSLSHYCISTFGHADWNWDTMICIWVTAILVGIYTSVGGLAAVVYTDAIQCTVMIAGCLMILVIGIYQIGGIQQFKKELDLIAVKNQTDVQKEDPSSNEVTDQNRSLVVPVSSNSPFVWPGILFGLAFILSPAYWIGNQAIVQRSLGAKNEFQAKASYIWGAVLKSVIPIIVTIPALIAVIKFPNLEDGDQAFPHLVSELLPVGLRGLFLAAFIAALMSSIDSYLNSAATIVTNDLYSRFINPDASDKRLLFIGRTMTILLVIWGIFFAHYISTLQSGIYAIFQTLMAFFQGPALAVLMTGLFWKRATGIGAFAGFLSGICCSVSLYALNQPAVYKMLGTEPLFQIPDPFLYFSIWAFLVAMSVIIIVSFFTTPEPQEKLQYLYSRRFQQGENK